MQPRPAIFFPPGTITMAISGGYSYDTEQNMINFNDLWLLTWDSSSPSPDTGIWTKAGDQANAPMYRSGHTMAAYKPGDQPLLIVHGGLTFRHAQVQETERGTISDELFVYGVYSQKWLQLQPIKGEKPPGLFFAQQLDLGR
jgi:hypothetical protein